ncbi:MAG: hypothetical protein ACMZ7B_07435 [Balneola sp.]
MNWTELNKRAYTPYSKNPQACLVQGSEGGFYPGVRIENVSFPLTISAIQAACCICLSEGETPATIYIEDENYSQIEFWKSEFELSVKAVSELIDFDFTSFGKSPLPAELPRLKKLLKRAVTTHSDFPVSALLYTKASYFEGVNIEVSDWSMGLCAERVALAKAIVSGVTTFTELAVHTKFGDVSSPCGACRQVIFEHLPLNKIRLHHADGTLSEHFSVDLLPFSFTSKSLKK